eukprot:3856376-Prymnesium_polylepis.1
MVASVRSHGHGGERTVPRPWWRAYGPKAMVASMCGHTTAANRPLAATLSESAGHHSHRARGVHTAEVRSHDGVCSHSANRAHCAAGIATCNSAERETVAKTSRRLRPAKTDAQPRSHRSRVRKTAGCTCKRGRGCKSQRRVHRKRKCRRPSVQVAADVPPRARERHRGVPRCHDQHRVTNRRDGLPQSEASASGSERWAACGAARSVFCA